MTRSESKDIIQRWINQRVFIDNPEITSPAALSLLAKKYYELDKSIYSDRRMKNVVRKWRKIQLKFNKDSKGGLTCAICGQMGLKDDNITLDHIVDIRNGGSWRDFNNFQVACSPCNHKKSITRKKQTA